MYSEGCEYVNIAWALGSKVLPYSNSSRSMALDNLLSPNSTLYSEENKKKNRWRNGSKVMSKSMIKHLCRHNKKANCGLLPCMKKEKSNQQMLKPRQYKHTRVTDGHLKDEALKK